MSVMVGSKCNAKLNWDSFKETNKKKANLGLNNDYKVVSNINFGSAL